MAQYNFSISQQTNFNNNLFYTKIFSVFSKTELFANQIIRTLNLLQTMKSYLDNIYYYVNDLPIIMNIKSKILISLKHYEKAHLV